VAMSTLELNRCEIRGNQIRQPGSGNGGGLNSQASHVSAINTLIVDNDARGNGGGIYNVWLPMVLLHCTVAGNMAIGGVGDSFYRSSTTMEIISSLIADDHYPASNLSITASYSVMPSSWPGGGTENVVATPSFVGGGDYHLTGTSAGIDRADGLAAPVTDLEGNPRYDVNNLLDVYDCAGQTGCVSYADCGTYEYHP
jgi:hypothetical protein